MANTNGSDAPSTFTMLLDALLEDGARLDDLLVASEGLRLLPHLIAISAAGLLVHGLVVGWIAEPGLGADPRWVMPVAFVGGFMTAIAVCLPSFYFYTQLAGLDASFRLITLQSMRVQAKTSIMLLGVLPFYTAIAFAAELEMVGGLSSLVFTLGLALPFGVGLVGIASLYRSFQRLVDRLPITHERRGRIMLRLVLCWGAVFSSVAPVALWRIHDGLYHLMA